MSDGFSSNETSRGRQQQQQSCRCCHENTRGERAESFASSIQNEAGCANIQRNVYGWLASIRRNSDVIFYTKNRQRRLASSLFRDSRPTMMMMGHSPRRRAKAKEAASAIATQEPTHRLVKHNRSTSVCVLESRSADPWPLLFEKWHITTERGYPPRQHISPTNYDQNSLTCGTCKSSDFLC